MNTTPADALTEIDHTLTVLAEARTLGIDELINHLLDTRHELTHGRP